MIGDPVAHSLSPAIHNAAFAATGLDWAYVALPVAAGRGSDAVRAATTLGLAGLSVTTPHKHDVIAALDRLGEEATRLAAVNCIRWEDGAAVGENTDGAGVTGSLRRDLGVEPAGRRCVVLGAGGAARAAVLALAGAAPPRSPSSTGPERAPSRRPPSPATAAR